MLRSLKRCLHAKGQFLEFETVLKEYFEMRPAEQVPKSTLQALREHPYAVVESSTTTKVFDPSAKSLSGISLNDTLLVGPTVHSPLVDVLLRFCLHRITLTTRMYRAVMLALPDRNLHRFVWRQRTPSRLSHDPAYLWRVRLFDCGQYVRQTERLQLCNRVPTRCQSSGGYVDDGLTGADSVDEAVKLQSQLQELFERGGFLLRKWNSNNPRALQHIPLELRDSKSTHSIPDSDGYTKALGI